MRKADFISKQVFFTRRIFTSRTGRLSHCMTVRVSVRNKAVTTGEHYRQAAPYRKAGNDITSETETENRAFDNAEQLPDYLTSLPDMPQSLFQRVIHQCWQCSYHVDAPMCNLMVLWHRRASVRATLSVCWHSVPRATGIHFFSTTLRNDGSLRSTLAGACHKAFRSRSANQPHH